MGLAAVFVPGLTMFSGFGLCTLLMPVFALFFPIKTAVAATALVHGANSIFKISVDWLQKIFIIIFFTSAGPNDNLLWIVSYMQLP